MANEQNLTGTPIRSGEEAARKGRNGGVASGKSRREKRDRQGSAGAEDFSLQASPELVAVTPNDRHF